MKATLARVVRLAFTVGVVGLAGCSAGNGHKAAPLDPRGTTTQPGRPIGAANTTTPNPRKTTVVVAPSTTLPKAAATITTTPREPIWTQYSSTTYKVALRYPPNWTPPADSEAKRPYFFSLGAASTTQTLAETCKGAAHHPLMPFGPSPVVHVDGVSFGGQPACIIEPDPQVPSSREQMAQVMVRYPTSLQLPTGHYELLVLAARNSDISAIASTLSFSK